MAMNASTPRDLNEALTTTMPQPQSSANTINAIANHSSMITPMKRPSWHLRRLLWLLCNEYVATPSAVTAKRIRDTNAQPRRCAEV